MSLSRLALRLAAVLALTTPTAAGGYPTAAGSRVFDSRIEPISDADAWAEFLDQVEGKPVVTVYTEEQEAEPSAGDYPADRHFVELVVEILIAAKAMVTVEDANGQPREIGAIEAAISTPQLEAQLDLIEQQVFNVLNPQSAASPLPYSRIAMELHHLRSAPMRDATGRLTRQLARTLTLKLRIPQTQPYGSPPAGVPADIAGLPQPLLMVALALPPESDGGQLVRSIARGQAPQPPQPRLADVRLFANLDRGAAPAPNAQGVVADDLTADVRL